MCVCVCVCVSVCVVCMHIRCVCMCVYAYQVLCVCVYGCGVYAYQVFSKRDPYSKLFSYDTKMSSAFLLSFYRKFTVAFSENFMTRGITTDWMQKQIWNPTVLCLSQTSEDFKNVKQCNSFHYLFLFGKGTVSLKYVMLTFLLHFKQVLLKNLFLLMAKKHMKRYSKSLIIKETQIKTTMRYHLTPVRMLIIKKSTNSKC